jgi:hypothetical protein
VGALFSPPLCFEVLLSIENIPAHTWSLDTAQTVVGSSYLVFEMVPRSVDGSDMSRFLAVVWAIHPDLILEEVMCVILESLEPFVEHHPPLFLRASEIIHSSCDTLQFRAFVKVLEVHDFNPAIRF